MPRGGVNRRFPLAVCGSHGPKNFATWAHSALHRHGRAARRQRAGGPGQGRASSRSRPALDRRAPGRDRGGARGARPRGAGLYRYAGPARLARGDIRVLRTDAMAWPSTLARIVVTTGSSAALVFAFLAAFEPGDRVALAAPGYPAYRNILTALDLVPVELQAGERERYQVTLDLLRATRSGRRRPDRGEPGQPDRHHDRGLGIRRDNALLPRPRHPPDIGRGLSRHRLRR